MTNEDCEACGGVRPSCPSCGGSGEGRTPSSTCRRCSGTGEADCEQCAGDDDHGDRAGDDGAANWGYWSGVESRRRIRELATEALAGDGGPS